MMPLLSLFINIGITVLLVAVIVYCRTLNRNIRTLQDSKSEMAKLFAEFDQSIERASQSVTELKEATGKADSLLKEKLDTANMIADDLSFLIERGNRTADQLENGLKGGRSALAPGAAAQQTSQQPSASSYVAQPRAAGSFSPAEEGRAGVKPSSKAGAATSPRNAGSLESVLEQMANRNNPGAGNGVRTPETKPNTRIRSKAEQELFDSLKSNR